MSTSPRPADVSSARAGRQGAETQPSFTETRPRFTGRPPNADRIAQRAYERYEARGREDGHDVDDWFDAERELQAMASPDNTEPDVNPDDVA